MQTAPRNHVVVLAISVLCFALPSLGQTISYIPIPNAVGSGLQSSLVRARLSTGAHGGVTVRVASDDTTLAFVTDAEFTKGADFVDIFVPNGSTDALFWIQALEDTTGMVHLTATATGFSNGVDSTSIVVPGVELSALTTTHNVLDPIDEFYVRVGVPLGNLIAPLQKVRAGGPGLTATLTNTASGVGELVTTPLTAQVVTVVIVPGQNSSPFTIASGGVGFKPLGDGSTDVSVSIPGFISQLNASKTVTVSPASLSYLSLPALVGIGLQKGNIGIRTSGTQHGGTTVHLESGDSSKVLLSMDRFTEGTGTMDVFFPNGTIQVLFYAQVTDTAVTGPIAITATAPGFLAGVDTVHVIDPFFTIASLQTSIDVLDPIDQFTIAVGRPNGAQTLILEGQQARGGGPGITMTATSSDSTVGMLETLTEWNDSVAVVIPPGEFISASTIGAGGVGFDGVGVGATQVTALAPGFSPVTGGIKNITVTQPGVTWINIPSEGVPAGLQSTVARVQLQASGHGGVNVHIASRDTNLVLLSKAEDVVGSDTLNVWLPNGSTDALFYMQGKEDTTGTVTLYTEAAGFTPDSTTVNLVTPLLRITPNSLLSTLDTLDPPDDFHTSVGLVSGPNFVLRDVRPGSPGVTVSVQVDTSLAELQTLGGNADSVTVHIPALSSASPSFVGSGGVALNGLAPGNVTVSVSAPGFLPAPGVAEQTVSITAPTMSFSGLNGQEVGSGLQTNLVRVLLSAPNHGGVTVRVESEDSTLSLAAATPTSAGVKFLNIPVADANTFADFYVQGLDDTTGTARYTATAGGFIPATDSIDVVQPAVEIFLLQSPIDVADGTDPFRARVGIANLAQTSLGVIQVRRGGALALEATIVTSDPVVSQLLRGVTLDDTVTVGIAAGESMSPADVGSGGVGHEPQAAGQTLITASIPGFIQTGAAQQTVDITNQNVSIAGVSGFLGAGLQTPVLTAQMGDGNHGGVTMHIESDDSSKVLLSLSALALGVGMLDVPLANGSTDVPFYVQAYDSSLGTVTVTASVTGFNPAAEPIQIVPPGTEIILLADSIDVADPDDEFVVRIGAINNGSTGIVEPQGVWAGSDTVLVTVSSSDPLVGEAVNLSSSGASVTVNIPPAGVQTAGTVPTGGVAFHPVGAGTTVVKAEVPDFVTTAVGSTIVSVTGTATAILPLPAPAFSLEQNVPNPFNPTTSIRFTLPARTQVELSIFDVRGRRVATLVDRKMSAGLSSIEWDGRDRQGNQVSSGVYFYRIVAGRYMETRKMVMLK